MNKVRIPDELNEKDSLFFVSKIIKIKSDIHISKDVIYFVNNIENRGDKQIILYVLYKIAMGGRIDVVIDPTPKNGLQFTDYKSKESLCIFHCHLNNDKVLIWYLEKINDKLNLKIEYIDHPQDDYKMILNNIYKNSNGYNIYTNQYFKDYKNNTYLKDNFIFKWKDFIKKYIN